MQLIVYVHSSIAYSHPHPPPFHVFASHTHFHHPEVCIAIVNATYSLSPCLPMCSQPYICSPSFLILQLPVCSFFCTHGCILVATKWKTWLTCRWRPTQQICPANPVQIPPRRTNLHSKHKKNKHYQSESARQQFNKLYVDIYTVHSYIHNGWYKMRLTFRSLRSPMCVVCGGGVRDRFIAAGVEVRGPVRQ